MTNVQLSRKIGLNTLISWGASVVIVGLTFKILHWRGGEWMIGIGLLVEAFLFGMLGFAAMKDRYETDITPSVPSSSAQDFENLLATNMDSAVIERLRKGFEQFNKTVESVNSVAGSTEYTQKMFAETQQATAEMQLMRKNISELNSAYRAQLESNSADATQKMLAEAHQATAEMVQLRKNLAELNNIYRAQLDAFKKA